MVGGEGGDGSVVLRKYMSGMKTNIESIDYVVGPSTIFLQNQLPIWHLTALSLSSQH